MSHPTSPSQLGMNRTGIATSPIDSKAAIEAAQQMTVQGSAGLPFRELRTEASKTAPPVGTMPPPASLKEVAKDGLALLKGHAPSVFLDKLGERLAFERTGVRLYDALISKWDAADAVTRTLSLADLGEIRSDELRHAGWLKACIEELGADPTVMTPCADASAVLSLGIVQVLTNPSTTFSQALEAILAAELLDNAAWDVLGVMARQMGHEDMAKQFALALAEEETHLARVRGALEATLLSQSHSPRQSMPAPEIR